MVKRLLLLSMLMMLGVMQSADCARSGRVKKGKPRLAVRFEERKNELSDDKREIVDGRIENIKKEVKRIKDNGVADSLSLGRIVQDSWTVLKVCASVFVGLCLIKLWLEFFTFLTLEAFVLGGPIIGGACLVAIWFGVLKLLIRPTKTERA
jgi:hypothetical protein